MNIDICLLQEVEIAKDYQQSLLTSKNFKIEVESNDIKSRSAIIIRDNVNYTRRSDIEGKNLGIVIIDLNGHEKFRIINVYRSFNPPNMSQLEFFVAQLAVLKIASSFCKDRKLIIAGDFNLDENKRYSLENRTKSFFEQLNEFCEQLNLIQMVNFPTWRKIVNDVVRESVLDHIYVVDPFVIANMNSYKPLIGDHVMITFEISAKTEKTQPVMRRNWSNYNKNKLLDALASVNLDIETDTVQDTWNLFETRIIEIVDDLAPLITINTKNRSNSLVKTNTHIKRKLNLRKRLLTTLKNRPTNDLRDRVSKLNFEIRKHFSDTKIHNIRKRIRPNNSKSLWEAVKVAKDVNIPKLPSRMTFNNIEIANCDLPDYFAKFFKDKVADIVEEQQINDSVYNGKRKICCSDLHFMTIDNIVEAVKSLKNKNSEGHDRIPQRILIDGIEILKYPLSYLFNQIYVDKKVPEQWLISKITPIFKKGSTSKIENYRPISNLCSASKIFEKLILQRIKKLDKFNNVDLTGKSQHGFKHKHSTKTAGLKLQSIIARALDGDNYALMATLDLSSAFDVVNVELLLKRLKIMGLPSDIILLVSEWLTTRYFYVSLEGGNSCIHSSGVGTVQGSILGPILYALFVCPVFDLAMLTMFADDNYIIHWNKHKADLIIQTKNTLELIIKWMKDSGLKVNDGKTETCLFYRKDTPALTLTINNANVITKTEINVLGVTFDSKLTWQTHTQMAIAKSKKALQAIRLIKKYLNKKELINVIRANFFSILYYNASIWLLPSLRPIIKKQILSASASALKLCCYGYDRSISYENLHKLVRFPTPKEQTNYLHAILLYETYNDTNTSKDWIDLFFNQSFNTRYLHVKFFANNIFKPGNNLLANRFTSLNNLIPYEWLNYPFNKFKSKCKKEFLNIEI